VELGRCQPDDLVLAVGGEVEWCGNPSQSAPRTVPSRPRWCRVASVAPRARVDPAEDVVEQPRDAVPKITEEDRDPDQNPGNSTAGDQNVMVNSATHWSGPVRVATTGAG